VLIEQGDRRDRALGLDAARRQAHEAIDESGTQKRGRRVLKDKLAAEIGQLRGAVASTKQPAPASSPAAHGGRVYPSKHAAVRAPAPASSSTVDLPPGEAATLEALIQYPDGLERSQLTVLTGYKRSSRDAYIVRLKQRGFVEVVGDRVQATDAGIAARPNARPLPTGAELQQFWFSRLPEGERKVLEVLVGVYPEPIERVAIDESTGYQRSSRDAYLVRLRAKQLVEDVGRGSVKASQTLFEVA
jgi:hypothetical protein